MAKFPVVPLSVAEIAAGFADVAGEAAESIAIQCVIETDFPGLGLNVTCTGKELAKNGTFTAFKTAFESRPQIRCTAATLKSQAEQPPSFSLLYRREKSDTYFFLERASDSNLALKFFDSLASKFNLMSRGAVQATFFPQEAQELIQFRENAVANLEAQVSRLGVFLTEMARKNVEATSALTAELEKRAQQKQLEADERHRIQKEALDADRQAFEKTKAEFDDRQRTHVRRALLSKIEENIKKRETATPLTTEVNRGRLAIHIMTLTIMLLALVGGALAGNKVYHAAGAGVFDYRALAPFTFCALTFAATLIFYLRWMSQWADRLAHNDLAVSQYASDILRASWIAELLFEYKDEQQKEIPPEVISSLTEGLFRREPFRGAKYHPTDDFAAFLKRITAIKASPNALELSADAKTPRGAV